MHEFVFIAPWVFGSVAIGVGVGYYFSRNRPNANDADMPSAETQAVLKVLLELLGEAEKLECNVATHNTAIQENAREVDELHVTGQMESIKERLLQHMTTLVESNEQLKEDLVCTRYRLEESAQEIDHARQEARSDELTGVANRRAFDEKLHLFLDAWQRENVPFALILADLDHFKRVNDSHGHQVGDRVLQVAGDGLNELTRASDFVSRYGGDEFAILLTKVNEEIGLKVAKRICDGIANALCHSVQGIEASVTFSMGLTVPRNGDTDNAIVNRADQALYQAKQAGGNRVVPAQESDTEAATAEPG